MTELESKKGHALDENDIDDPERHTNRTIAWLQVLAGHLTIFNSWGYMTSFGMFQPYYVERFRETPDNVAWIGTIGFFAVFFMGIFAGRLADAGYTRLLMGIGFSMQLIGVFTTSVCKELWQAILAEGICQGFGFGLTYTPMISVLASYFREKRLMAICLQTCGASTGGLVFPAIAKTLLPSIGFPWTVRVMGFVILFNVIVIMLLLRPYLPPRKSGPMFELAALKEPRFLFFTCGMFLTMWGNWVAFFYLRAYAIKWLDASDDDSFSLLLVLNGIGIIGRIVPSYLAERWFGALNTSSFVIMVAGVLMGCWISVKTMSSMWALVVFYGLFSAATQSMFPASMTTLTADPSKQGVRSGMGFSIVSFATLSGCPIAGQLIQTHNGRYLSAQEFACASMLCGSVFVFISSFMRCSTAKGEP
jgi:hypothetical protein